MNNNNTILISYRTLRQLIGVLGILLPFLCWGINIFVNHFDLLHNSLLVSHLEAEYQAGANLKSSISHFYYTAAAPLFIGILISVAIFLFTYNGYTPNPQNDRWVWLNDKRISTFAACCLLGIVVFPTDSYAHLKDNLFIFETTGLVGKIHLSFAALFFISMAVMSIVNFRRLPNKRLLNDGEGKTYFYCGWGIIFCLVMLTVGYLTHSAESWFGGKFVFVMEVIMLLFFGISWLTKGESIPTEFVLKNLAS
ncbi:MAG: hypothetical protein M9959_14405 [Chitinophagaceae bacterium]|nr:hypothetical protein [Chitinophagaceae bacterium]